MFASMYFQRVQRLRVLKFLWLEGYWIQRQVPSLTALCTKASNAKKPVRYTSIKKAKPKTINDIAKLLQQKSKERKQSVINTTKAASPNQSTDRSDAIANVISNENVPISTFTVPAKDSSESSTPAVASLTGSSLNETTCETVDFAYSKDIDQVATNSLCEKTYTEIFNSNDLAPASVDSCVESTFNAPQEATNITQVSSYDIDVSNIHTPKEVPCDETHVVMTSTDSFTHGHQDSEDLDIWPSNIIADNQSSDQAFRCFPDGTAILDISEAETVDVGEACHEDVALSSGVSLFKSIEHLSVVEIGSACLSEAIKVDGVSELSADVQSSISLKDPIFAQTDVLEEEKQTEAVEKLPEAQLDPVQRLFLDKIREYSTRSQASGGPVDAGPEYEKIFCEELAKLQRRYGGGDLFNFPEFKFSEPELDENNSK